MEKHFVTVAKVDDLEPGTCRPIELDEISLALFNIDGKIYALDNVCPHAGGPLGEGTMEGTQVACPWHGWKFDITTGTCMKNPIESWRVPCYKAREQNGNIQVVLQPSSQTDCQDTSSECGSGASS
ncbi:MAG: (2Fe-2S)-binding protein [Nitrospirales bacterium]|nr:MAG: (2Fe-2S)-binding protein [Nitrospirales bacterium]